ncbi:MAG: hypothetical protein NTW21_07655 [Verrucomicrobia bacterium]|nr:hypothetical protein [Verrucomicrobiota bacterium]
MFQAAVVFHGPGPASGELPFKTASSRVKVSETMVVACAGTANATIPTTNATANNQIQFFVNILHLFHNEFFLLIFIFRISFFCFFCSLLWLFASTRETERIFFAVKP